MRNFVKRGWEVHLVTQERGFHKATWEGCSIHYIDGFDDNDLHIHQSAPQLRRVLTEVKPDIVHVHNIMPYYVFASIVDTHEFPTILTIHNTPQIPKRIFGGFKDFESERMFTRQILASTKYDKLLVGSRYYLDCYAEVAPWIREKAAVAYYFPPDITTGPLVPKTSAPKGQVKLLFPSRILQRKGIEECIMALAKLPKQFKLDLPAFAHTEDTHYQSTIKELIGKLDLNNRVFTPMQVTSPEMMRAFYQDADIVLIPSHYEGFGIVAVEAMSWGVPVIASKIGGLGEIIRDGENGVSVIPRDVDGIVEAVELLASDRRLAQKVVQGGLDIVKSTFNRERHMQQIELVYKRALQNKQERKMDYESREMAATRPQRGTVTS